MANLSRVRALYQVDLGGGAAVGNLLSPSAELLQAAYASSFRNAPNFDLTSLTVGADITAVSNTSTGITDGVTIGGVDYDSYQLQGIDPDLLEVSAAYYIGEWPSGAPVTKWRSFFYTGQTFELLLRDLASDVFVYVDGVLRVQHDMGSANAPRFLLVDLGDTPPAGYARRIDVVTRSEYWNGLIIEPDTQIWPTQDELIKLAFIGDSYVGGSGSDGVPWSSAVGMFLNLPGVLNFGIGGSGYINGDGAEFINRLQEVLDQEPDYVIVAGGINDQAATVAEFTAAVDQFYDELTAAVAPSGIIICSPFSPGDPGNATLGNFNAVLKAKAEEIGARFIDFLGDEVINGTGDAGNLQGDGNADLMITDDGIHPTQFGHCHLGRYCASKLLSGI